jgi:1,4-dihydroxy-2-naphthoyl-CoA hydrolase
MRIWVMDLLTHLKSQLLPFAGLLGIELVSADADRIVGQMTVRPEFCTQPPVLHGGAIMAFADTLGALATVANLAEGTGTTTIESKTNFIGAAPVGTCVIGETTPVHKGRRTMVWQTKISTSQGKPVALVTQTQLILRSDS